MSNESEIRKYLAEREAISREYLGIKENEPIPAEKPKKPTIQSLESKIQTRDRTIAALRKQLKEASEEIINCQNELERTQTAFIKFQKEVEELLETCVRIEILSVEPDKASTDIHWYASKLCENLLEELQKLEVKYNEQR